MLNLSIHGRVALLIDADNIHLKYIEQIVKLSEYYGKLEISRAYGDWNQIKIAIRKKMDSLKIECVHVESGEKDATDIRLSLDAGVILGAESDGDQPNVFVIASGDGGFAATYTEIRQRGKQVIGIGNSQNTSKNLEEVCDSFHYVEELDRELSEAQKRYPIPPNESRKFFEILQSAYSWTCEHREAWVSYDQINNHLHAYYPDYENDFGMYTLSEWLKNFEQDFENYNQNIRSIDPYPKSTRRGLIINAYIKTYGSEGLASLSKLAEALRRLDPNYEGHFGSRRISKWLKDYPEFKVHNNHVVHERFWRNKEVISFLSQPTT